MSHLPFPFRPGCDAVIGYTYQGQYFIRKLVSDLPLPCHPPNPSQATAENAKSMPSAGGETTTCQKEHVQMPSAEGCPSHTHSPRATAQVCPSDPCCLPGGGYLEDQGQDQLHCTVQGRSRIVATYSYSYSVPTLPSLLHPRIAGEHAKSGNCSLDCC